MDLLWWKEKRLRTVWRVKKDGRTSFLVGTAHFSPYPFKKSLTRIIKPFTTVLFEGPLDQESMARVVEYGRRGEDFPSLDDALEPGAVKELNRQLSLRLKASVTSAGSDFDILYRTPSNLLKSLTQGVRPWLGFFSIWSTLLNWKYSMDVEAYKIAQKLKKRIEYLETIEDQLSALDGIPFERIVNFLNRIDHWNVYREMFLQAFLSGDLERFASMTGEFPTRCESIVARRDPVFFKRIKAFSEQESVVAFVGVIHIPGIRKMFLEEGYTVAREEA
ncbi:MAG: TraB/GumN family protein [Syntrophaceae bacterium]|nr:TraB/GumN family protein [Syntrophaceae bacterium]